MTDPLDVFYPVDPRDWIVGPGLIRVLTRDDRPLIWVAIDPDNVARVMEGAVPIARATLFRGPSGGYMPASENLDGSCRPLAYSIAVLFDGGEGALERDMLELGLLPPDLS